MTDFFAMYRRNPEMASLLATRPGIPEENPVIVRRGLRDDKEFERLTALFFRIYPKSLSSNSINQVMIFLEHEHRSYLVTGGVAAAIPGTPRMMNDIDIRDTINHYKSRYHSRYYPGREKKEKEKIVKVQGTLASMEQELLHYNVERAVKNYGR